MCNSNSSPNHSFVSKKTQYMNLKNPMTTDDELHRWPTLSEVKIKKDTLLLRAYINEVIFINAVLSFRPWKKSKK